MAETVQKNKKRWVVPVVALLCLLVIGAVVAVLVLRPATSGTTEKTTAAVTAVKADPAEAELSEEDDLSAAEEVIQYDTFWVECDCTLEDLRYLGDEESEKALATVQSMFPDENYTRCAVYETDFRSSATEAEAAGMEPDTLYKDYRWTLARTDTGDWEVVEAGFDY